MFGSHFGYILVYFMLCHSDPRMKVDPCPIIKYPGKHVGNAATTWKHTKRYKANQNIISNERATGITLLKQYI